MPGHKHLPHLSRIWSADPVYFVTTCTHQRKSILANSRIAQILIDEWISAHKRHGWIVGRYVIMPDHVHFFCSADTKSVNSVRNNLSFFMQQWKQWTSKRIIREIYTGSSKWISQIWQKEYFDHLLRSEESYIQKWEYVRENPVRKNLVYKADDWSWQGEIFDLS